MTKDFRNEENTISIGGHYFEASMEDNSYLNIQINLREKDLITEEIIKQIGLELKDFVSTICKFGWGEMFKETLSEDKEETTLPTDNTSNENVENPKDNEENIEGEVDNKEENQPVEDEENIDTPSTEKIPEESKEPVEDEIEDIEIPSNNDKVDLEQPEEETVDTPIEIPNEKESVEDDKGENDNSEISKEDGVVEEIVENPEVTNSYK